MLFKLKGRRGQGTKFRILCRKTGAKLQRKGLSPGDELPAGPREFSNTFPVLPLPSAQRSSGTGHGPAELRQEKKEVPRVPARRVASVPVIVGNISPEPNAQCGAGAAAGPS